MTDSRPALLGGTPLFPEGPPQWPGRDAAVEAAVQEALVSGAWGKYEGGLCQRLRDRLRELHNTEFAILTCSGTAAVELALRGLKVSAGDEVLLAAYDFKANFTNILTVGALPVLVDVDPVSGNLDVGQLASAITPQTKAILVSHLHGGVVPMPEVMEFARSAKIPVIEDACQMPGATIAGKIAGTWGDVGMLSFGGSKTLTAGRGGALVTNSAEIAQRIALYTQRGNEAYPLSELQAAALLPQLDLLEARNHARAANVKILVDELSEIPGLLPFRNSLSAEPGFYKLGFWYDFGKWAGLTRGQFSTAMRAEGIALDPGFRGLHLIHSRRRYRSAGKLPIATRLDEHGLVMHHPILLQTEADMQRIAAAVRKIQAHAAELASAVKTL